MEQPFLEDLAESGCWELIGSAGVGRIAVNGVSGGPQVVPVNYAIDDGVVVFQSDLGTKVSRLGTRAMSFQVDQIDPLHRTGWSVLIRGLATSGRRANAQSTDDDSGGDGAPESWSGHRNYLVRLVADQITGRRLRLPDVELDARGYL